MKPQLVIGLGNPLMGDDGAGCAAAGQLAAHPRLPDTVEVICGGTDLLQYARQIEGRTRVIVIDAMEADGKSDDVLQEHVHHLSAVQAIQLLRLTTPAEFILVGVPIRLATMGEGLSPAIAERLAQVVERVLKELL